MPGVAPVKFLIVGGRPRRDGPGWRDEQVLGSCSSSVADPVGMDRARAGNTSLVVAHRRWPPRRDGPGWRDEQVLGSPEAVGDSGRPGSGRSGGLLAPLSVFRRGAVAVACQNPRGGVGQSEGEQRLPQLLAGTEALDPE